MTIGLSCLSKGSDSELLLIRYNAVNLMFIPGDNIMEHTESFGEMSSGAYCYTPAPCVHYGNIT